jgi:hypothetical protein
MDIDLFERISKLINDKNNIKKINSYENYVPEIVHVITWKNLKPFTESKEVF